MRIVAFQHVPFETPARIGRWARRHGHALEVVRTDLAAALPVPDAYDALVVLGGPMGVPDAPAWLAREIDAVARAVDAGRAVLGVCLGAQVIAAALGARVFRMARREIGWFPVTRTVRAADGPAWARALPEVFVPLHWHGDTFELPAGARRLARSDACENQLVEFAPRVAGLQFHLEMERDGVEALIARCADELEPGGPTVQTPAQIRAGVESHCQRANELVDSILDALFAPGA